MNFMGLELYMLGLIVQDMSKSLEFYRRLGVDIPENAEEMTHVEVKMGSNGFTFFLDSWPQRWDSSFVRENSSGHPAAIGSYPSILEFYLKTQNAVDAKYAELIGFGYQSQHEPYDLAPIGMRFAMIKDPDGNVILLSGDLEKNGNSKES